MGALLRRETRGPFSGHLGPARVRWAPCPLAPAGLMGNYLGLKGKRLPQGTEWPAPGPCQFTGRGLRWSQPPEDSPDPILRRTLQVWPGGRETGCRRAASRPRPGHASLPVFKAPWEGHPAQPRPCCPLREKPVLTVAMATPGRMVNAQRSEARLGHLAELAPQEPLWVQCLPRCGDALGERAAVAEAQTCRVLEWNASLAVCSRRGGGAAGDGFACSPCSALALAISFQLPEQALHSFS